MEQKPRKIKVLIVDGSATIRALFSDMLGSDPDIEVVATAEDPFDAREKIKKFLPDVLTLDIEMPKMDGISFLEKIMQLRPMPVVMAPTLTLRGADITIRALEMGAIDYIAKPSNTNGATLHILKNELIFKVKNAARSKAFVRSTQNMAGKKLPFGGVNTKHLIAIGASTGGVEAIHEILKQLPENAPPIVITQHMPELFTTSFARRMDGISAMRVVEAKEGDIVVPGAVYIAPGNYHMEIREHGKQLVCAMNQKEAVSGHRPSVDVMFESIAAIKYRQIVAAILTGMGKDGAQGLKKLRDSGATTLGQNEASCVVYGMPKAAMAAEAVEKEIALSEMARTILHHCSS